MRLIPPWVRVIYLVGITIGIFLTESPRILIGLLVLQCALWVASGLPVKELVMAAWRLKFFFLLFILLNMFTTSDADSGAWGMTLFSHRLSLDVSGLLRSILMCGRVITIVFTSMVVRRTGESGDFVRGMRTLFVPEFLGLALDGTLMFLSADDSGSRRGPGMGQARGPMPQGRRGEGGGKGTGGGRNGEKGSFVSLIKKLLKGDIGFLTERIGRTIAQTREYSRTTGGAGKSDDYAHDLAVVTGMAVVMMSLKFLKVMPGLPVAPGWKNLMFIPLLILSSELTLNGWGGTLAGSTMGIVAFMFGDGKYGIFEVFQHVTPGIIIDVLWPVFRKGPRSMIIYGILGFLASVGKFATIVLVLMFMESKAAAYAILVPFGGQHLIFGSLSGIVTYYLIGSADSIKTTAGISRG